MDLPETSLWWTQQHQHQQQQPMMVLEPIQNHSWALHHQQPPWFTSQINENNETQDEEEQENDTPVVKLGSDEKEAMFEKPLTPSDVGKLNRLVIPKQYAERYFPLGGGGSESSECKGLLLSFEDESGKCWRFRYSYWNSSQSYVLTKGWSRYVKDKRLDAGDVVLFERHRVDSQRLFINWRRRNGNDESAYVSRGVGQHGKGGDKNEVVGVGVGWSRGFYSAHLPYPAHHLHHHQLLPYQNDHCLHAGRVSQGQNQRTKPVGNSSSSRVLRLFGVNMECQPEHEHEHEHDSSSTPQCSYDSNNNNNNMPLTQYHQPNPSNSNPHVVRHQPYYY